MKLKPLEQAWSTYSKTSFLGRDIYFIRSYRDSSANSSVILAVEQN